MLCENRGKKDRSVQGQLHFMFFFPFPVTYSSPSSGNTAVVALLFKAETCKRIRPLTFVSMYTEVALLLYYKAHKCFLIYYLKSRIMTF